MNGGLYHASDGGGENCYSGRDAPPLGSIRQPALHWRACGRASDATGPSVSNCKARSSPCARSGSEVVIKHEDIKGFMPGMTMPFTVKDDALLSGKQPGDLVTATLVVGETQALPVVAHEDRTRGARPSRRHRRRRPTS